MKRWETKHTVAGVVLLVAALIVSGRILVGLMDDSDMPISSRETEVQIDINYLRLALERFELDNGAYPPGTNGLRDLLYRPAWATNWQGPYIKGVILDPWKHEFHYRCPGEHTNQGWPYDLFTKAGRPINEVIANWQSPP